MTQKKYIKRIDNVTALEITERNYTASVTLLHRGERVHTSECNILLLPKVIEDHRKIYGNYDELLSKYPEGSYVERVFVDQDDTGELIAQIMTKFGVRYAILHEEYEEEEEQ